VGCAGMRRLVLVLALIACRNSSPSQKSKPPPPTTARDGGAPADAGPQRPYRTPASDYDVDPTLAATGTTYMVTSEDEHATKAGADVLAAGGNAVDAAIAVAFTLAVTRPTAGNVGSGRFAVVRTGRGQFYALDWREDAAADATPTMYEMESEGSLLGPLASGVPGLVPGLWAQHEKWGTRPWKQRVAPAIALARSGYQVTPYLHQAIA